MVTLFRPENSTVDYPTAKDAADFCGLDPEDMIAFTLERLITHELLIRVTVDLSVPDGPNYEELGLNLRGMVARIRDGYVAPHMPDLSARFADIRETGAAHIRGMIDTDLVVSPPITPAAQPRAGLFSRLFGRPPSPNPAANRATDPAPAALARWQARQTHETDPAISAALSALIKVTGAIMAARGRLMADADILTRFALNMYLNQFGSAEIGRAIEPIIRQAAADEGYRYLPAQEKPFLMNVKGASASGKSTIRPHQRALAEKMRVPWEDFALISPDYWRKYLLDYASLGVDHKFAAMLTGQELELIDKKLDAYVTAKAASDGIPHLLIDRFRFDSFSTDAEGNKTTQLLTRFGDTVFLFFMVTPPAETVVRAWARGLDTGRFKAVDDLLFHNIEAYEGIPQLLLNWIGARDKKIHFEFLDNAVPFGALPRTIAFGSNDQMTVLDVDVMHDVDRFRAVNVEARAAADVLLPPPELTFLKRCVGAFPKVSFMEPDTRKIYAQTENGEWVRRAEQLAPEPARLWLSEQGWADCQETGAETLSEAVFDAQKSLTLGDWT